MPTITTDDSSALVVEVAATVAKDKRGVVIRLDGETLALSPAASVATEVTAILGALGVAEDEVDLLIDLGLVRTSTVAMVTTAEAALRTVPTVGAWRNLVVAFSAFPESIGDVVDKSTVAAILREDAVAYTTMIGRSPDREPVYGDYVIGTPFYVNIPWAPIPAIRYASDQYWYIHRGATKANRSAQYVALATGVVAAAHYAGAAFSSADNHLDEVASGSAGPGNPTTYVRVGAARHMSCVLERLATLGEP